MLIERRDHSAYYFSRQQLNYIQNSEVIYSSKGEFDPSHVLATVRKKEGQLVRSFDIGGSRIAEQVFQCHDGRLVPVAPLTEHASVDGEGYLDLLEKRAELLQEIPVAISVAGLLEDKRLIDSINAKRFTTDMIVKYGGDFSFIFPNLSSVVNDAIAGASAGSVESIASHPESQTFIYVINGSGIGTTLLHGGRLISIESGHIQISNDLNHFNQQKRCGSKCKTDGVCLKHIAASGAGIESIWFAQTGDHLSGKEISILFQKGDRLAAALYENSAMVLAHVVYGIINRFVPDVEIQTIPIICHGGCFKVPGYFNFMKEILEINANRQLILVLPENNLCLEGAALQGIMHQK